MREGWGRAGCNGSHVMSSVVIGGLVLYICISICLWIFILVEYTDGGWWRLAYGMYMPDWARWGWTEDWRAGQLPKLGPSCHWENFVCVIREDGSLDRKYTGRRELSSHAAEKSQIT